MDFGKRIHCGNFTIEKRSRSLSKAQARRLRDEAGVPDDVRKHLSRASLPYMRVENVSGGWAVEIGIGMSMFDALDGLSAARDENGDWRVPGIEGKNAEAVLTGMYMDTTVVGDAVYQGRKLALMCEYLKRQGEETVAAEKEAEC